MFTRTTLWSLAICGLAVTGCQTHTPKPIDRQALTHQFPPPPPEAPEGSQATSLNPTDANASWSLTLSQAKLLALFNNQPLRVARLQAAVAAATADHAGHWDDPTLDLGLMRNTDGAAKPWTVGLSLGFTLPISGRLEATLTQAKAEHRLALAQVAQAEFDLLIEVETTWVQWQQALAQAQTLAQANDQWAPWLQTADHLAQAGELAPTDARLLNIQTTQRQLDQQQTTQRAQTLAIHLQSLLGIAPTPGSKSLGSGQPLQSDAEQTLAIPVRVQSDLPAWVVEAVNNANETQSNPIEDTPAFDPFNLPSLQVALLEHDLSEATIAREIAKQRPDLAIGPSYENEEGQSKIGLGLGIPLPILNANKQAIAQARAEREVAIATVTAQYQQAIADWATARQTLQAATAHTQALQDRLLPLAETQLEETQALFEIGEQDVLVLHEALAAVTDARLAWIEAQANERIAEQTVKRLLAHTPNETSVNTGDESELNTTTQAQEEAPKTQN